DGPSSVAIDPCADDPWNRKDGWTDGGLAGAALGLKLAGSSGTCTITRVHGMPIDTTPRLVAIAAIRAVWAALAFAPDEPMARRLEACVSRKELPHPDLEAELAAPGTTLGGDRE